MMPFFNLDQIFWLKSFTGRLYSASLLAFTLTRRIAVLADTVIEKNMNHHPGSGNIPHGRGE